MTWMRPGAPPTERHRPPQDRSCHQDGAAGLGSAHRRGHRTGPMRRVARIPAPAHGRPLRHHQHDGLPQTERMKPFLQTTSEEDKELPGDPERPGNIGLSAWPASSGCPRCPTPCPEPSGCRPRPPGCRAAGPDLLRHAALLVVLGDGGDGEAPGVLDRLGRQAACPVVDGPRLTGLGMDGGVDAELCPGGAGDLIFDRDSVVCRAPGVIGVETPGAGDHGCAGGDERGAARGEVLGQVKPRDGSRRPRDSRSLARTSVDGAASTVSRTVATAASRVAVSWSCSRAIPPGWAACPPPGAAGRWLRRGQHGRIRYPQKS